MEGEAAAGLSSYEWQLLTAYAALSGIAAFALAVRDHRFRGAYHLAGIGVVGSISGLGVVTFTAHFSGGILGVELLLAFMAVVAGLGGRVIEHAITTKGAKLLGVDIDPRELVDRDWVDRDGEAASGTRPARDLDREDGLGGEGD